MVVPECHLHQTGPYGTSQIQTLYPVYPHVPISVYIHNRAALPIGVRLCPQYTLQVAAQIPSRLAPILIAATLDFTTTGRERACPPRSYSGR